MLMWMLMCFGVLWYMLVKSCFLGGAKGIRTPYKVGVMPVELLKAIGVITPEYDRLPGVLLKVVEEINKPRTVVSMLMRYLVVGAVVASTAALTASAPPAHADDQSFLAYLEAHGQSTTAYPFSPAMMVQSGHSVCVNLHAGSDAMAGTSWIIRSTWGPIVVEAAQHELCPDTLH